MEPLKPEEKRSLLANSPQAQPGDIAEYERLLADRFTVDPDVPQPQPEPAFVESQPSLRRESRLQELALKLYPNGIAQTK